MVLQRIGAAQSLDAGRDDAVVCVFHDGRAGQAEGRLAVVDDHTPADVPIVVVGLSAEDEASLPADLAARLRAPDVPDGLVLHKVVERVVSAADPADVVLLTSDCWPPAHWLPRLRDAAIQSDAVGTATPLTSARLGSGRPREGDDRSWDNAISAAAASTRPRVQVAGPGCLYVRRSALQLIGVPASAIQSPAELIEHWSAEVVAAGLLNVLADDLFVGGDPQWASQPEPNSLAALRRLDDGDETSPLRRAVALARSAERGLAVTIDGRSLNRVGGGTQRYTLELVLALHRFTDLSVRVVIPPDPAAAASDAFAERPEIEVITYKQAAVGLAKTDVVHRPQQVFSAADLTLLRLLGDRLVVTHQDLIAYHNYTYHSSVDVWAQHRRISRLALAVADRVVFFSEAAKREALTEDLVPERRCDVVGVALDDPFPEPLSQPPGVSPHDDYILCLGADYRHKNRPFAILVTRALREEHGWGGRLVFAGAHVEHGSSAAQERALLDVDHAPPVLDLGSVADPHRAWLMHNARAIIVPSVVEGFGLVPLEAAAAGVPCLFAAQTSLREVVSESLATLVPWDAQASARRAIELLEDEAARAAHVRRLREDAARWRWERLAGLQVESYERAIRAPFRVVTARAWQELERERILADVSAAHHELVTHLGDRQALARDDGFFTPAQQRGLLRVGSRPALARAVMWPFALLGDLGSR